MRCLVPKNGLCDCELYSLIIISEWYHTYIVALAGSWREEKGVPPSWYESNSSEISERK